MTDHATRLKRWRDYESECGWAARPLPDGWETITDQVTLFTGHTKRMRKMAKETRAILRVMLTAPRIAAIVADAVAYSLTAPGDAAPTTELCARITAGQHEILVPADHVNVVGQVEWFLVDEPSISELPFALACDRESGKPCAFIPAMKPGGAEKPLT